MKTTSNKETLSSGKRTMAKPAGASVASGLSRSMFVDTDRPYGDAELHESGSGAGGYMRESKKATTGNIGNGLKIDGGSK